MISDTLITGLDWDWIERNIHANPDVLRLAAHGDPETLFAITQIDCRQRTYKKLHETLRQCPHFVFDSTLSAQQCTSDELADYHSSLIEKGMSVFDMTGGLGIDALHCSGKSTKMLVAELDMMRAACASHNFRLMKNENVLVQCSDSTMLLKTLPDNSFDCIFIDPARRGQHGERLFALSQCMPDVTNILNDMLRVAKRVIIKASPMLDVIQIQRELHNVKRIIALGTATECKELVIICGRAYERPAEISATTIINGRVNEFKLNPDETPLPDTTLDKHIPTPGDVLYDPYPATAKIMSRTNLSNLFGIKKIAPNTNLFISRDYKEGFPGQAFDIIETRIMNKKTLKEFAATYPRIDITAKNFPMTAQQLTSRMKTRSGNRLRLFACRNSSGDNLLIVAIPRESHF